MLNKEEYEIPVGVNSIAVVAPDFSPEGETMSVDVHLYLNCRGNDEQDSGDNAQELCDEGAEIFIDALKKFVISQGGELSEGDFTQVVMDA